MSGTEVILQRFRKDKDKYNRTLADVFLRNGTHVNHMLIKDGWCWWYRKYAPGNSVLEGLEKDARVARKGLWADPQPVPPWELVRTFIAAMDTAFPISFFTYDLYISRQGQRA